MSTKVTITGGPGRYELGHIAGDQFEGKRTAVFQISGETESFEGKIVEIRRLDEVGNLFALEVEGEGATLRLDWYSPCARVGIGRLVEAGARPKSLGFAMGRNELVRHVFSHTADLACPWHSAIVLWDNRRVACRYDALPLPKRVVEIRTDICYLENLNYRQVVSHAVERLLLTGEHFAIKWHNDCAGTFRYVYWEQT